MATSKDSEEQAIQFPRDKDQYQLIAAISSNTFTKATYKAKYVNPTARIDIPLRIKTINTYKCNDICSVTAEIHEAKTYEHENIVKVHCSFKFNDHLWIVMPSLSRLSLRSVIRSSFPKGLSEINIAFALRQTLEALNHMHAANKLHQNLDAGCIFLDRESRVKIALRSLTYEESYSGKFPGGYPSWTVAPELMMDRKKGNSKASDVWMFGLLALELFYGRIPVSDFGEFKVLVVAIEDKFGVVKKKGKDQRVLGSSGWSGILGLFSCFRGGGRKVPEALGELMAACLSRDPGKRATTDMLMECEFLKKSFDGEKSLAKLNKAWTN